MGRVLLIDTETTGMDEPALVEIAYSELRIGGGSVQGTHAVTARYNPGKPIQYGAMATHGIIDEDVADMPAASSFGLPDDVDYLVGHNIDYDWEVIGKPDVKRICTLAMAREMYQGVDSHSLLALMYFFNRNAAREFHNLAHGAGADVKACLYVLNRIVYRLGCLTWDALWQHSEKCRIPTLMPFGKHKGMPIADIPYDYKRWLLKQPDVDPYLVQALTGTRNLI